MDLPTDTARWRVASSQQIGHWAEKKLLFWNGTKSKYITWCVQISYHKRETNLKLFLSAIGFYGNFMVTLTMVPDQFECRATAYFTAFKQSENFLPVLAKWLKNRWFSSPFSYDDIFLCFIHINLYCFNEMLSFSTTNNIRSLISFWLFSSSFDNLPHFQPLWFHSCGGGRGDTGQYARLLSLVSLGVTAKYELRVSMNYANCRIPYMSRCKRRLNLIFSHNKRGKL